MSAEYDPANQGNAWDEEEEYGVADRYDRSANTQHSSLEDEDSFPHDPTSHAPGDVPSDDGASDAGDYDPETVTSSLAPTPHIDEPSSAPNTLPKPQPKKPKTAGGFIVESDSEDEDDSTAGSSGLAADPTPYQPNLRTTSPRQSSTTVPRPAAASSSLTQGHAIQQIKPSPAVAISGPGHASAAPPAAASAQQQFPRDKIAMLEDRVREDPRGAMDSWIALLREYRDRNRVEDARKAYDRFLVLFPHAVSHQSRLRM